MSKEPHPDSVPAETSPPEPRAPADETVPAQQKPIMIGRPRARRNVSRWLVTAYFAVGLVLLLAGTVTVVYLAADIYDRAATSSVTGQSPAGRLSRSAAAPGSVDPSGPLLERIGPQRLANGETFVVQGERGAKFEVTVRTRKFRKTGCDSFARKPENGGYLPTELRVKVLAGEPAVSDYAFRFQRPDGTWLNSAYGSNCDKDYGAFVRRLVAGRTYKTTIVFDVPDTNGDIVFVYPTIDVIAAWHLG